MKIGTRIVVELLSRRAAPKNDRRTDVFVVRSPPVLRVVWYGRVAMNHSSVW